MSESIIKRGNNYHKQQQQQLPAKNKIIITSPEEWIKECDELIQILNEIISNLDKAISTDNNTRVRNKRSAISHKNQIQKYIGILEKAKIDPPMMYKTFGSLLTEKPVILGGSIMLRRQKPLILANKDYEVAQRKKCRR